MTVKQRLLKRAAKVDEYLENCFNGRDITGRLLDSMNYSLMAGGKRLRPVLVLSWAGMLGANQEDIMPFAASMECIHTYSLIHDDLPAMDDDDLRRGRPSNHKKFDEATAILAGDGLLTEAFVLMFSAQADPALKLKASDIVARAAGAEGMVGGQCIDMDFTGKTGVPLEELKDMHSRKTGALIRAACMAGATLSGKPDEDVRRAYEFGKSIGVAFQIVDDVLDVVGDEAQLGKPVGSDQEQGKTTYPSLIGLDQSKRLAQEYVDEAKKQLAPYAGDEALFLSDLAQYIVDRVN